MEKYLFAPFNLRTQFHISLMVVLGFIWPKKDCQDDFFDVFINSLALARSFLNSIKLFVVGKTLNFDNAFLRA